jgi:lycopene beta-cyclase
MKDISSIPGTNQYDYIIAGGGAAGMSLILRLINNGLLEEKRLLLVERDAKNTNDRTWCFWEQEAGFFDEIVYKRWSQLNVYANDEPRVSSITPYTYKMIRGIDFYRHCLSIIDNHPSIHRMNLPVNGIENRNDEAVVTAGGQEFTAPWVFSSLLLEPPKLKKNQQYLLQHFHGWIIEAENDFFDPETATFMDFRVPQQNGATFCYVLPFSKRQALIEYTLFSKEELEDQQYESGLHDYIENYLRCGPYKIIEKENGIIPMTDYKFKTHEGRIVYLGTAAGNTRGSSGYTFRNIQKHSQAIADALQKNGSPLVKPVIGSRAQFYDAVLLGVLGNEYAEGKQVFTRLLKKMHLPDLLSFLDGESKFGTDLKVILSEPKRPFIRAVWKHWMG